MINNCFNPSDIDVVAPSDLLTNLIWPSFIGDDAMDVDTAVSKGGKKGGAGGGKKAGANKKKTASTANAEKETPPTEAVPEITTTDKVC